MDFHKDWYLLHYCLVSTCFHLVSLYVDGTLVFTIVSNYICHWKKEPRPRSHSWCSLGGCWSLALLVIGTYLNLVIQEGEILHLRPLPKVSHVFPRWGCWSFSLLSSWLRSRDVVNICQILACEALLMGSVFWVNYTVYDIEQCNIISQCTFEVDVTSPQFTDR